MATSAVNFFQPGTDAAISENAILRQRALAQAMMQQGATPQTGQMVGNRYVAPSPLSYVNQLAQMLGGQFIGAQTDEKERALGQQIQAQRAQEAQAFMQAANGTPASTQQVPTNAPSDSNPNGNLVEASPVTTPAVPGDMNKALALALQSQNPMLQGMAPEIMKRNMDAAELNQALQSAFGGSAPGATGGSSAPMGAGAIAGAPGAVPPAPGTGFGVPPGVSPQALPLLISRNAQANKLGTVVQDASKPIVLAEGGTALTYGPGGQLTPNYIAPKTEPGIGVSPVPGQPGVLRAAPVQGYGAAKADIAGQVAGAEAGARDPYAALVRVDTPDGPRMMTPAQARAAAGQGAPAPAAPPARQAPQGGQVGVRGSFEGTPEQVLDTINASPVSEAVKTEMRRAYANQVSGNNPEFNAMGTGALPPGGMATGGASNPAGAATGGPNQGAGAGRGIGIPLQTEEAQAYQTARAKSYAEQAPKLQQAGQDAASSLRNLDTLQTLYKDPNVAKGALAENISGLKNIGASFGIDVKGLPAEQAIQSISNKMALASRSTAEGGGMPGSMSDQDRKFLVSMQPGLSQTPEGRALIMDASRKVAQRQIDVANMARQYEMQHGQLDIGFDKLVADYAAQNQMFTQATPGGGSKTNLQDLLNKYR